MSKFKFVLLSICSLIGFIVLIFTLELGGLQWKMFFAPKHQNVERKVFENTKSYSHGQQQNLAKMYKEYQETDEKGKETIKNVISVQFSEFDSEIIQNRTLRNFLIQCRGY